jgi:hypothetical protein
VGKNNLQASSSFLQKRTKKLLSIRSPALSRHMRQVPAAVDDFQAAFCCAYRLGEQPFVRLNAVLNALTDW